MKKCTQDKIGKALLIIAAILAGLTVALVTGGCATTDNAKYIERHCPIRRVSGDLQARIVRDGIYYDARHCYMIGNCWRDANAICRWAKSKGIKCDTLYVDNGNHVVVVPEGSAYRLEYIDGLGLVRKRK